MPAQKKPKAPIAKPKPVSEASELVLIRKLAEILNETGLTEIELDHKGAKVRVSRTVQQTTTVSAPVHHQPPVAVLQTVATAVTPALPEITGTPLKSPMVGTAYLSATPGGPPFAEIGSLVKEGQTLLIIEAMKTMNQITAPRAGKLVKVNIANAQAVEFGEILLVIE